MPQKTQPAKTTNGKSTNGKSTAGTARAATKRTGADKFFYMKFRPNFIDTLRDQLCADLNLETHAELPLYFRSPHAFPAAIGLSQDLENRYNIETGSEEQKNLNETLRRYFGSSQYAYAMSDMSKRYSLDMKPADEIQDGERKLHQRKVRKLKSAMEKRQRERENSQNEAAPEIPAEQRPVEADASRPADPAQTGPTLSPNT